MGAGEAIGLFVLTLYIFLGLGVVCDEWFVPSLEKISESLNLSSDVAGATFLAAGSSAPELFTSVADTFGPGNSIGIGTIVGSAMFNILIIVALSAAATTKTLDIDWRPVVRDCGFYTSSIILLVVFFQDEKIYWYESGVMLLAYGAYILFMVFNARIFGLCRESSVVPMDPDCATTTTAVEEVSRPGDAEKNADEDMEPKSVEPDPVEQHHQQQQSATKTWHSGGVLNSCSKGKKDAPPPQLDDALGAVPTAPNGEKNDDEEEEEGYFARFEFPFDASVKDQILWAMCLPYYVLFTITIPDCSKAVCERLYIVTFVMSIAWIAVLCAGMVMSATYIGCIVQIGPVVMGMLVVAIGTSVPDALGSMIVAKAGEADMAIANAVGSNVFDILLGLGFPWFVKTLTTGEPVAVMKCGVELAVLILFSTVFIFFGVLIINKWKMNNRLGIAFLMAYGLYFVYTLLTAKEVLPGMTVSDCTA
jgi:K+-dependent Na+/Ca+ exchanger-like protein